MVLLRRRRVPVAKQPDAELLSVVPSRLRPFRWLVHRQLYVTL